MAQQWGFSYKNILSISFFHITFYQSKLSRKERLENKKNTVRIKGQFTPEWTIFLFDDVISTGATANDCARILKYRWAKKVVGIFLASNIS